MTRGLERATMFGAVAGFAGAASGAVIGTGGHFGAVVAVGLLALACLGVRLRMAGVRPPARMRGPRTQKVGAAAFGVLLVGSLVVGSVGAPVGAANAETAECSSIDRLLANFLGDEVICAEDSPTAQVIEDAQEQNAIEDEQTLTDLKQLAAGQYQKTQEATAIRKNYIEDAETVAWSKGEAAFAAALNNRTDWNGDGNFTVADARGAGIEAMADYWTEAHQRPMAESWNATMASAKYVNRVAANESGLNDSAFAFANANDWKGNLTTSNVTLANGTVIPVSAWEFNESISGTVSTGEVPIPNDLITSFEDASDVPTAYVQATNESFDGDASAYSGSGNSASGTIDINDAEHSSLTIAHKPGNIVEGSFNTALAAMSSSSTADKVAAVNVNNNGGATYSVEVVSNGSQVSTEFSVNPDKWYEFRIYSINYSDANWGFQVLRADGTVAFDSGPDAYGFAYVDSASQVTHANFGSTSNGSWFDHLRANGSTAYGSLTVYDEDGDNQKMVQFEDYGSVWQSIESTDARLEDNFEVYANETYSAWENGTVNATDYVSSTTLMQEYATSYNSSGYYTYAVAALSQAGLSAPSISNTSHMDLRYTPAGPNATAVNLTGMLMSQDGPTYGPNETAADGTDLVNGTWYSNRTYATENVSGNELFIGVDGTQQTLNGTFVVEGIYNRSGDRIESAAVETYNYKSQSADDFVNQTEQRAEFRAMLEALEPSLSGYAWNSRGGGWGLGGLLSNGPTALLIGLVAALLILRN